MSGRRTFVACGLFPLLVLACNSAPDPLPEDEADVLRHDIAAISPPPSAVLFVGPERLFRAGEGGMIVLSFEEGGRTHQIPLYNGYVKVLITVLDEMQALGLPVHAEVAILDARRDDLREELTPASDAMLDSIMSRLDVTSEFRDALLWDRSAKIEWIAQAQLLRMLQGALPAPRRAAEPDGAQILAWYFRGEDAPSRVGLTLDVGKLEARIEQGMLGDHRTAEVTLGIVVQDLATQRVVLDRRYEGRTEVPGAGVTVEEGRVTYEQAAGADPVERCLRSLVRTFARDLISVLGGLGSGSYTDATMALGG